MIENRLPGSSASLMKSTAQIVTAHVAHNTVKSAGLPAIVSTTKPVFEIVAREPAVPITKSLFPGLHRLP